MKDKNIFKKAIEKAIKNGYQNFYYDIYNLEDNTVYHGKVFKEETSLYEIIFDHDFAKAFWGENKEDTDECYIGSMYWDEDQEDNIIKRWEYHLTQMVLEKEPLKYIEQYLED